MSQAFEITPEDIGNVLRNRFDKKAVSGDTCNTLMDTLDLDAAANAALSADELDEQTDAAYDELERQLRDDPEAMATIATLH